MQAGLSHRTRSPLCWLTQVANLSDLATRSNIPWRTALRPTGCPVSLSQAATFSVPFQHHGDGYLQKVYPMDSRDCHRK